MGFVRKENYYDLLQVSKSASTADIESQYQALVSYWRSIPPLLSPSIVQTKLLELTQAFHTLKSPDLRESYDESLDFDFVLIDGKVKDPEMEDAYQIYLDKRARDYHSVMNEFSVFKEELGDSLWILKSTTIFLLFSLLLYSVFYIGYSWFSESWDWIGNVQSKVNQFAIPVYLGFVTFGFYLFRTIYQIPKIRSRKEKRG